MPHFINDWYDPIKGPAMRAAQEAKPRVVVLGLGAMAGAGKDTFLSLLAERADIVNVKFADALTDEVAALFSERVTREDFQALRDNSHDKDVKMGVFRPRNVENASYRRFLADQGYDTDAPMSIRDHLVLYGTDYVRQYLGKDDEWLNKGLKRIREVSDKGLIPVVTDVRFPNEAQAIKDLGGTLVSITADWLANRALDAITAKAEGLLKDVQFDAKLINVWGDPASMKGQFYAKFRF